MTDPELTHELESLLELAPGSLRPEQSLATLRGWDSMASVLLIAFADENLGISLSGDQVAEARNVGDLLCLLRGTVNA